MRLLFSTILAASLGFSSLASANAHEHDTQTGVQQNTAATAPWVEGSVKKIDLAAGKVTLKHGPLTNLDMPAMTMAFRVKNAAWLKQMKENDRIRFTAESINGTLSVVRFEPVK